MDFLLALAAALLPAILLWVFIWQKDPQKEPTSRLFKATLWGVAIVVPVILVESIIELILFGVDSNPSTILGASIEAFFVAALPEESFKLLVLWLVLRKNPFFDEHFDGIVYSVCIGLGFAAIENVFYVLSQDEWLSIAISRALLAVPGHYAFAVIMGYYYSVYHFVNKTRKTAAYILLIPFLAHGIYDSLVMGIDVYPWVEDIFFFILIYFCIKMHRAAKKKIVLLIDKDKPTAVG